MKNQDLINRINDFNYCAYIYGENRVQIEYWQQVETELRTELNKLSPAQLYEVTEGITANMKLVKPCFGYILERAQKPTRKSFRSKVFKMAHALYKNGIESFAVCLARAWKAYRLRKRLLSGVVEFCYKKLDGSLRKATGTLKIDFKGKTASRKDNFGTVAYFDLGVQSFRSFRIENLI